MRMHGTWRAIALAVGLGYVVGCAGESSEPAEADGAQPAAASESLDSSARLPIPPSDAGFLRLGLFPLPLVPVGATSSADSQAFAEALDRYVAATKQTGSRDSVAGLLEFLEGHPDSPWKPVLLVNLGSIYRQTGHFSRALAAWQDAWERTRALRDPAGRALGDAAVGHLSQMLAYLGRKEALAPLLAEVESRPLRGTAAELVSESSRGLADMELTPELSFKCGPFALARILQYRATTPPTAALEQLHGAHSTANGLSLTAVQALSRRVGLNYQMAFREPGAEPIVPAVAHFEVGHYAAIVEREGTRFRVEDATFGEAISMERSTLDEEASGYFLIPAGPLPAGWRSVEAIEGERIWGRGDTGNNKDNGATGAADAVGGGGLCSGCTVWSYEPMVVSLALQDAPIGYNPPFGPSVSFDLHYSHRDVQQPQVFNYTNLGHKWTTSWLSYVTDNLSVNNTVDLYRRGGGNETYGYDAGSALSKPGPFSQTRLARTTDASGATVGFARNFPDGSREEFNQALGLKFFLSAVVDAHGNSVQVGYDAQMRIVTLTDAAGQVSRFAYEWAGDPLKLTSISDPFGRTAKLTYNADGNLESITDLLGIVSKYSYDGDFIRTVETPYGQTHFEFGDSTTDQALGNTRFLNVTDVLGRTSRVEFRQGAPGISATDSTAPTGMSLSNDFLQWRNTFVWNPAQYAAAQSGGGLDYTKARVIHWLHTGDNSTSRVPESVKEPLEGRVWFDYAGQTQLLYTGTSSQPLHVGRVLDDGKSQVRSFEYNDSGKLTLAVDPLGRTYRYEYAANGVDLTGVRNVTAGIEERWLTIDYAAPHLPSKVTGPSGGSSQYEYNARGQVTKLTDPLGNALSFSYDARGYVIAIDGPAGAKQTFTRDEIGRVLSATDAIGVTLQHAYDVADRRTKTTYPDGTSLQFSYNLLDLASVTDRLGHTTVLTFDPARQLTQIADGLKQATKLAYALDGNLAEISAASGSLTKLTRDVQGRLLTKQLGDGSVRKQEYERRSSRLRSVTDARNQTTIYDYTLDDALAKLSYTGAAEPTAAVSFAYDTAYKRLLAMTDALGETRFSYHPIAPGGPGAGALESVSAPIAGQPGQRDSVQYRYDVLGRVVAQAVDGSEQTFDYDTLGRLTGTKNALDSFRLGYGDATARLVTVGSEHGPQFKFSYYPASANGLLQQVDVTKLSGAGLASYGYSYDAAGNIRQFAEGYRGEALPELNHGAGLLAPGSDRDGAGGARLNPAFWLLALVLCAFAALLARRRISPLLSCALLPLLASSHCTSANVTRAVESARISDYTYDLASRLTSVLVSSVGDAMPATPQFQYGYDAASNLTELRTSTDQHTLAYTAGNLLELAKYDENGSPKELDGSGYGWDGADRLVKITKGDQQSEFSYDGMSRLVRVVEKRGAQIEADHSYFWCGTERCLEHDNLAAQGPALEKQYFPQGFVADGQSYYYVTDHLGSVRQLVDASGRIRAQYDYDPYGRQSKKRGDLDSDVRYAGYFQPTNSGPAFAMYRAYDAAHGRWLNRDPIGEAGGLNLHAYANANPVNTVDPAGTNPAVIYYIYACALNPACVEAVVAAGLTAAALLGSEDAKQMLEAMVPISAAEMAAGRVAVAAGETCAVAAESRFATAAGRAFFWSGRTAGVGGAEVAAEIAASRGGTTLEQLMAARGIQLPVWDAANPATVAAWENASRSLAQGASGTVRAVIGETVRSGNVWETIELPALLANPKVTQIIKVDPATGVETLLFRR